MRHGLSGMRKGGLLLALSYLISENYGIAVWVDKIHTAALNGLCIRHVLSCARQSATLGNTYDDSPVIRCVRAVGFFTDIAQTKRYIKTIIA